MVSKFISLNSTGGLKDMIIVVGKWKRKLVRLATVIVLVALFAALIPVVSGVFVKKVPVFSGWMNDEHPSGNPLRVETSQDSSSLNQKVDRWVVKVQNFYQQEKE
jgi:hypothetical protein